MHSIEFFQIIMSRSLVAHSSS